jgi:hypothetical protein
MAPVLGLSPGGVADQEKLTRCKRGRGKEGKFEIKRNKYEKV